MFVTVTAATALVSVAINTAAVGVASYFGYRYLHQKYTDMKSWVKSYDQMQAAGNPKQTTEDKERK